MENTIELINQVAEFNDIHEFIDDPEVDEALALVVKIFTKPDIPSTQAVTLIAKLQALSAKFGILATYYSTLAKGPAGSVNNKKKNIYYTLKDSLDKLVDSLKYVARMNIYG
jgi:hypothetical protein